MGMESIPSLKHIHAQVQKPVLLDRHGKALGHTFENHWNLHRTKPLEDLPPLLIQGFLLSEDQRFYQHSGCDWLARVHAIWQAFKAGKVVRGASTITEQVIRMIHPRPRTVWSRWLEGFDAYRLEQGHNKHEILSFYLNQVPYGGRQRGVSSAAWYYYDRDIETLNDAELLSLAIMVRSPARLHPYRNQTQLKQRIQQLSRRLFEADLITQDHKKRIDHSLLEAVRGDENYHSPHFNRYVFKHLRKEEKVNKEIHTSLDANLQKAVSRLLDSHLARYRRRNVHNGAALVVDHQTGGIRAWASGGSKDPDWPGGAFDAVLTPRQPGSSIKPFLYAKALDQGHSANQMVLDEPVMTRVGHGIHLYRNYSRHHYGWITLSEALANSLNTPAILISRLVGTRAFLGSLNALGLITLNHHPEFYGEGIALGTSEVNLFSLVQAYTTFANQGNLRRLTFREHHPSPLHQRRAFSKEVAEMIHKILSDPSFRRLEFSSGALDFEDSIAVKTGTSTDYRDAWSIGWDRSHVVGIWLGNLNRNPTKEVSGASAAGPLLRSIFHEVHQFKPQSMPKKVPSIKQAYVCEEDGFLFPPDKHCIQRPVWHRQDIPIFSPQKVTKKVPRMIQPTEGLHLAIDPRTPRENQAFLFEIRDAENKDQTFQWFLNHQLIATTKKPSFLWPLKVGHHRLTVRIFEGDRSLMTLGPRTLYVK